MLLYLKPHLNLKLHVSLKHCFDIVSSLQNYMYSYLLAYMTCIMYKLNPYMEVTTILYSSSI